MRPEPKAIIKAMELAKKVATKIDPGFANVGTITPGIGAPLMRKSGGRAGFAGGGAPDPSIVPDFADSLYSHGERVAGTLPKTAPPAQMAEMLQHNGVKSSEMNWSGANDMMQGQPEVASADLAHQFGANMMYPSEKMLRDPTDFERDTVNRHTAELRDMFSRKPPPGHNTDEYHNQMSEMMRRHERERRNIQRVQPPYHEKYTLPGGKNYREILLRHDPLVGNETQFSNRDHFGGEPDIISSIRMKDRRDEETGAPVAHIEELQSDWGQAARHGYQGQPQKTSARDNLAAFERDLERNHSNVTEKPYEPLFSALMQGKGDEHDALRSAARKERLQMEARPNEPAPFIDKTDDWMGLGLKRALHEAAHGGHDKLAWTPGDDQFERYSHFREPQADKDARKAGMQSFYDKMLPKRLLQIARQHDPEAKLTTAHVAIPLHRGPEDDHFIKPLPALQITPRMRESIKKNGFPMYQRGGEVEGGNQPSAYFEVAPGKTWNATQQESWERLHPHDKADISNKMIQEFLPKWQKKTGIKGIIKHGLGGYGGFSNPNFLFHPHNPHHIDAALKGLGELFRQDAMMGAHEHPFEGSFPSGVVRVHMPPDVHPDEAHAAYKHLNGLGLAEGHSTDLGDGTMDILTDHENRHETARKIDSALGGRYNVTSYPTNISFPEHGEHYGISGGLSGGTSDAPAPQAHDHLQAEAGGRLQQLLDAAHASRGSGPQEVSHYAEGGAAEPVSSDPGLFDMSALHEVPKVEQYDLPRNVPARGIPPRMSDLTTNRDVFDKAMHVIQQGREKGGAKWYNADPLRDAFIKENGPDKGDAMFRKYMDFVAATSPRSEVGANVRNASYYFTRHASGHGVPEVGESTPKPYGHLAQRLHQMNAQRVAGAGWDPLNNPKPASFAQNLMGNQAPATVDTHAFRLPAILSRDPRFLETAFQSNPDKPKQNLQKMIASGEITPEEASKRAAFWQAVPKENEYGAMEQYYKRLARESGMTPAQTQASAWVGGGHITGLASDESKPFMGFVQDRIMKTAHETKMDPHDVLRKFVRGEMPLRASGGKVSAALSIAKKTKNK